MKFIMLVGLPGSGKTTYAKSLNANIVSSDKIREELTGSESTQINPKKVFNIAYYRISKQLHSNQDVVLDATNLESKYRIEILNKIINDKALSDCEKTCIIFKIPIEECIKRDALRERVVGKETIERMNSKYTLPTHKEGWDNIIYYKGEK